MTGATRLSMIDYRMSIGVLAAIDHIQTVNAALGPFRIHCDSDVMARQSRAEIYRRRIIVRVLTQLRPAEGVMIRVGSKKRAKGLFVITVSAALYQINWRRRQACK